MLSQLRISNRSILMAAIAIGAIFTSIAQAQNDTNTSTLTVIDSSKGGVKISIDAIIKDGHISGKVSGIASKAVGDYKILVYIHTDQWYIHPYVNQGENGSWAALKPDLTWSIPSVKRAFTADKVAALLVDATKMDMKIDIPATLSNLGSVNSTAWIVVQANGGV